MRKIIREVIESLMEGTEFTDENTGYHNNQSDMISRMFVDGKLVAYVQYTIFEGEPHIQYIEALDKGRGYGMALMDYLADKYGYENLNRGSLTPDGAKMRKRLDKKYNFDPNDKDIHISPSEIDNVKDPIMRAFMRDNVKMGYEKAWEKWLSKSEFKEFLRNTHKVDMNDVSEIARWISGSESNDNRPHDEVPYYVTQDMKYLTGELNDMNEDYPTSFDMEHFKSLTSFNKRIQYCEEHLQRISSGSGRIAYKIDDEKVLKLAKNKKGVAQNEAEVDAEDHYVTIFAKIFDHHPEYLWLEMELARKLTKSEFKKITGFSFGDFEIAIINHGINNNQRGWKRDLDKEIEALMWEHEFVYDVFDLIGSYGYPVGDLAKTSSYGIVKRDGQDEIVLVDYGLTSDVLDNYYS